MVQNGYDKFYHDGGKLLAHPSPGEEVVISGIAGVFPNSRNIYEMKENLFNKVDMVSLNKKWDCDHFELPSRLGAVLEFDKYDGGFFGVHERQSHSMDLMARIFQEKAMEAIFDAGLHPSELEGTRTGVYVAVSSSEHDRAWYFDNLSPQTFAVSGCERSMIAHRLSYFLKVKGPSVVLDTACSSSCYAVEHAYKAIRLGEVDSAVVGGTHLCLNPLYAKSFSQLGTLSKDGACKTFDVRADGYVRSEAIAVLVLQKAKDSKRIYARVHAHTNSDGFKEQSIAFPSKYSQMKLINDLYEQCGVDRFSLSFMEAHGTGTPTGDPQECAAFDNVLTNGRKKPLLIGSIKSNIGHTEPVSGLCSIIKCILAMEVGSIPPNIHFKTPNDEIAGLVEGRLKVVVDETPLEEENALMGINNFGIGGANAQVLLRRNPKKKVQPKDNLPRLACVSGRTEEAVRVLLDEIQTNETDVEYIKLMHEVFSRTIQNHLYRGYVVVSKFGGIIPKSFASCPEGNKPLYLTFGELDDWYEIGMQLMVLPVFQDIIKRLQGTVSTKSTDISNVFLNGQFPGRDCIHVAGAVIVQIALVQLLKVLDVKPSGCFGSSFGVLVSAYCNDILTLDQTIDCAFIINEAILKNDGLQHASTSATQGNQKLKESCEDTVSEERNKCQRKDIIEILLNTFTNESEFLRNDNSKTRIVSADSLVNALTTSRNLGIGSVKPNSVILKIGNFRSNDSEEVPVISLFGVKTEDHLTEFLAGLGSLYVSGCNLQVDRLYPQVDFPVGRGTPMISPFIRWNHSRDKFVPQYHLDHIRRTKHGIRRYKIDLADPQWGLIAGHVVDGKTK